MLKGWNFRPSLSLIMNMKEPYEDAIY